MSLSGHVVVNPLVLQRFFSNLVKDSPTDVFEFRLVFRMVLHYSDRLI